jgi:hypothetical protein
VCRWESAGRVADKMMLSGVRHVVGWSKSGSFNVPLRAAEIVCGDVAGGDLDDAGKVMRARFPTGVVANGDGFSQNEGVTSGGIISGLGAGRHGAARQNVR